MQSELIQLNRSTHQGKESSESTVTSKGVVLVKASNESEFRAIIPPAILVAQGLQRCVRLIEIVNTGDRGGIPIDPVDWDFRKRQARSRLTALIDQYGESGCEFDARVLQNHLPALATNCDDPHYAPIFCCARNSTELPWDLDDSIRRFMQAGCSSVLLVPIDIEIQKLEKYQRILLMLDGSARAERALPAAVAIAKYHHAELLILHATPDPGLVETGPLETEALELRQRLWERNRRTGRQYLSDIRSRFASELNSLTTRLLDIGDVRHQLVDAINIENVDLVLIASQGATGHSDVPTGSVAKFVLEHSQKPILMVCPKKQCAESGLYKGTESTGSRQPSDML